MAKREQFTAPLACSCGNKGSATWSENENPMHADMRLDRRLIVIDGDFQRAQTMFDRFGDPIIKCSHCGQPVTGG